MNRGGNIGLPDWVAPGSSFHTAWSRILFPRLDYTRLDVPMQSRPYLINRECE